MRDEDLMGMLGGKKMPMKKTRKSKKAMMNRKKRM